jgi:hypothetical protein
VFQYSIKVQFLHYCTTSTLSHILPREIKAAIPLFIDLFLPGEKKGEPILYDEYKSIVKTDERVMRSEASSHCPSLH